MRTFSLLIFATLLAIATSCGAGEKKPSTRAENQQRERYPKEWEVSVPEGTKLDKARQMLDKQSNLLPPKDLEDQTPLPIWFRVYLRKEFPELAKSGPYQYPRTANRILQRLLDNPDSQELDRLLKMTPPKG
jgi:hypothetical protein